jgi:drug/metabolite transporter (DMT)-like permease
MDHEFPERLGINANSMSQNKNILAYGALALICVVWGTTYLVLRIGVTQFPPFLFSLVRFLTAGPLLLALVMAFTKTPWPDRATVVNQAFSGLLMVTLGISVVGYAEVYISSGVAAIICSMMPIWTILINLAANRDDRPNLVITFGLLVGLAGILLIFREHLNEFSNPNYTLGIVLTFLANLAWAFGSFWIKKKNTHTNPFLGAGLQMTFGGLFLVPFSLAFDDYRQINWSGEVILALAYMSLIGSVAAYACYSYAIKKLPMTIVSLYAYINPLVAVLLGWMVLDEKFNVLIAIAMVVTIGGIYMVNRGYQIRNLVKTQLSRS